MPLHTKIFIGLALGAALGLTANWAGSQPVVDGAPHVSYPLHGAVDVAIQIAKPVGNVFLRLMFMVVLPLVFSALVLAVVEIGDVRRLGRVGLRTLAFTAIFSVTAVLLGLLLVNTIKPGHRLSAENKQRLKADAEKQAATIIENARKAKGLGETLLDIIPENPLQEMVGALDGTSKGNGMLAVMFFSLMFGAAIMASPEKTRPLIGWLEGLYSVSMTVIGWAMVLAPLGAGCLVFVVTARLGLDVLVTLLWFVLTVVAGLAIQLLVTYPAAIHFFSRLTPRAFFRGCSDAMVTAFGTSSSNATLPTALRVAEENLKLPPRISNFVLTVGATANQNGTALYEGVVVLFLAQLYDVPLTVAQQVTVVLMSILAGIGTAGVPGGSLPLIAVLAHSVGVPMAGIGVILGVDRVLDMCRTTLNVTGDLAVAACVAGEEDCVLREV